MTTLGTPALLAAFAAAAAATWAAGTVLSRTTDALDERLGLGHALGGMILLAIAGSLPEHAIDASVALNADLDMAAGSLIGGIAMQSLVLAFCDAAVRGKRPRASRVSSLLPVLEGVLVIEAIALVMLGALLPASAAIGSLSPASIAIVVSWILGIILLKRYRMRPGWQCPRSGEEQVERAQPAQSKRFAGQTIARIAGLFGLAALAT